MDKQQRWIRLQVSGGAGFNFILPANPSWKVHQLEDHMLSLYNQIAASELSSMRATKIKSLKRNGFFVATSLKVGHVFNDWDQVTCVMVTKNQKDESTELETKKEQKKSTSVKQTEKKQSNQRKKSEQVQEKKTDKVQTTNQKKKKSKDDSNEQKISPASFSADKLLNMMKLVRQNIKQDNNSQKKQDTPKDTKKQKAEKQAKTKEQKKSKTIIIEQESD